MRIETERLVLRGLEPDLDIPALHRIGADPRVARMMMSIPADWTRAQAAEFLERSRWRGRIGFRHAIALRSAPERMIGTVGIGGDPVSTAYFIDPGQWGRGYATEALGAFLSAVMPRFGLGTVEAGHFADNPASGAVLRKVGFEETGAKVGTSVARDAVAEVRTYRLDLERLRMGRVAVPVRIASARLILRPVFPEDAADVMAGLNDIGAAGWLARVPHPYGERDFLDFLEGFARAGETYAIEDAEGFAGVLTCGGDLGYWLARRVQGRGYATEAARAALAARFAAGGGDVVSGYFEGNAASARVLEKLGFVETGRRSVYCRALGEMRAHVDLVLTAEAFARRTGTG
ncbi:MAG: GNAT family N-acetyltransferase [Rhodobacteraceae bacterium]|nr:GNAT family N-acetyltransferase [Paracoccaceae bacterium]